jgi:hypothetical protein
VEDIRFRDNEVEVLVVDLGKVFCSVGGDCLRAKVLEKRPGNAGEEIYVCRAWSKVSAVSLPTHARTRLTV